MTVPRDVAPVGWGSRSLFGVFQLVRMGFVVSGQVLSRTVRVVSAAARSVVQRWWEA